MSNVNAPRGFKEARYVGGRPFSGAVNAYPIASGYASNIFAGDPVKIVNGLIQLAGVSDQIRGIAVGFYAVNGTAPVTNPFLTYWPASYVTQGAQNGSVLVIDDPDVLFEAVFTNSASVPAVADMGKYFNGFNATGNASTGLSGYGVDYSTKSSSSATFVWKFIDFVQRPNNDQTSANSRGLFQPVLHDGRVNAGAA